MPKYGSSYISTQRAQQAEESRLLKGKASGCFGILVVLAVAIVVVGILIVL